MGRDSFRTGPTTLEWVRLRSSEWMEHALTATCLPVACHAIYNTVASGVHGKTAMPRIAKHTQITYVFYGGAWLAT